jgi:hypothetical protein
VDLSVRGGGAIYFTANSSDVADVLDIVGSDHVVYQLGTEECAFITNTMVPDVGEAALTPITGDSTSFSRATWPTNRRTTVS